MTEERTPEYRVKDFGKVRLHSSAGASGEHDDKSGSGGGVGSGLSHSLRIAAKACPLRRFRRTRAPDWLPAEDSNLE